MTMPAETQLVTAAELLAHPEWGRCELVRGEVIPMSPAGMEHGKISISIAIRLGIYCLKSNAGKVFGTDSGVVIRTHPDTVRAPDVYFIVRERLPKEKITAYCPIIPDLCVEVMSPDDHWPELMRKVKEYLGAGVKLVWVVVPPDRTVHVFQANVPVIIKGEIDTLDGGSVLPGFECAVSELFE